MPGWDWVHGYLWILVSEESKRESACSSRGKRRKPVREGRISDGSSLESVNGSSNNSENSLFERCVTKIRKHCGCFSRHARSLFNAHRIPMSLIQRPRIDKAYKMNPFLAYQSQTRRVKTEEASVSSQSVKCLGMVISWPACRLARVGVPVEVGISRTSLS